MVEPPRADRDIHLRGVPEEFRGLFQHLAAPEVRGLAGYAQPLVVRTGTRIDARREDRRAPLRFTADALLVADPAHVVAHDRRHGIGLQAADRPVEGIPVVDLFPAVGALAVGAVEPHFVHLAVVAQQLGQLPDEEAVIGLRIAVAGGVPVPRREVDAEFHSVALAGVAHLADHVATALPPRRRGHRMARGLRRPEAEAVVVLGREDHHAEAGLFERPDPLVGIECRRIEQRRILRTVAPLPVGEGIDPEVQEGRQLHPLPGQLGFRGYQPGRQGDLLVERGTRGEDEVLDKRRRFLLGRGSSRQKQESKEQQTFHFDNRG